MVELENLVNTVQIVENNYSPSAEKSIIQIPDKNLALPIREKNMSFGDYAILGLGIAIMAGFIGVSICHHKHHYNRPADSY